MRGETICGPAFKYQRNKEGDCEYDNEAMCGDGHLKESHMGGATYNRRHDVAGLERGEDDGTWKKRSVADKVRGLIGGPEA